MRCIRGGQMCVPLAFGHCDWRLPTIAELRTILLAPHPCGSSPCIDALFGPTATGGYWSSTAPFADIRSAVVWVVSFSDGFLFAHAGSNLNNVRAVRGCS